MVEKNRLSPPAARPVVVARPQNNGELPPHDEASERAALCCVLMAGEAGSQQEVEALLYQLKPSFFYDLRHKSLHKQLVQMRMAGHAVDLVTVDSWLRQHKVQADCGGYGYIQDTMMGAAPSQANFQYYLPALKQLALRRWCLAKTARLSELARATELEPDTLKQEFSEIYEHSTQIGSNVPLIRFISPKEARAYQADPKDFMVGDGLINRGMVVTIGGEPGVGKSRLAMTLAVAGARGTNRWQNYPVRCKWRTAILQTENDCSRLNEECLAIPEQYDDYIRITDFLGHGMAFDSAEFRRELRSFYDHWPFEMLVIDPWNDVSFEEGQRDYKQALMNIKAVFRDLPKKPATIIVAHLRKRGRDDSQRRKTGRELLHELSGSLALGSESRTVFIVQAATASMDDSRIVFEVAKANNCNPEWLREHGTRSAWVRANSAFESVEMDWDQFDNPGDPERRKITEEMLRQVFDGEGDLKPSKLAKKLKSFFSVGESTAHRAIGEDGYLRQFMTRTPLGLLRLKDST
jgi:hypothetical protein